MHRFNFTVFFLSVVKIRYKKILYCYINKYYQLEFIKTVYFEVSATSSATVADLLLDEALRPMNEGPGSYGTAVTVATTATAATQYTFIPAHSPSKLCCRNAQVYRFDHSDISKHFC